MKPLPADILLEIFSYLPLKSLTAVRGVCSGWKEAFGTNSNLPPIRRDLLTFYHRFINSPIFLPSRPLLPPQMERFDREQHISCRQHANGGHPVPEDYCTWVLEWPSSAIIGWLWPGLRIDHGPEISDTWWRRFGQNGLGFVAIGGIPIFEGDQETELDPGLRLTAMNIWSGVGAEWQNMCFGSGS